MSDIEIRFSPSTSTDTGSFRLIELPPELCQLVESAIDTPSNPQPTLCIKGHPTEDAVFCTADRTYAVRSVLMSSTVLAVMPSPADKEDTICVRDQMHEVLELTPTVPRLNKLATKLRGMEYDEGDEEQPEKLHKYSCEQALREIQASETEFHQGLKDRRVLVLDGYLRPIAPAYLSTILELLLSYLVSLSIDYHAAPVEELVSALTDEHEIPCEVSKQVISWFGTVKEVSWEMDVDAVVAQIGLGILRHYKDEAISEPEFISKWKRAVGDSFEGAVALQLLSGNYLQTSSSSNNIISLYYFPASALPTDPTARFRELFLTRRRWKADEIKPFLSDITGDPKEHDKLLLKHARIITTPEGTWYSAKTGYSN